MNPPPGGTVYGRAPGPVGLNAQPGPPAPDPAIPLQQPSVKEFQEPPPTDDDRVRGIGMQSFSSSPILSGNAPDFKNVRQGFVANCPLPAILVAMVHTKLFDKKIKITEHASKVRSKQYNGTTANGNRYFSVQFPNQTQEVSDFLFVDAGKPNYGRSKEDELWVSLVEKAYVAWKAPSTGYQALNAQQGSSFHKGVDVVQAMNDLLGTSSATIIAMNDASLTTVLGKAGQQPVLAAAKENADSNVVIAWHAYTILKFTTATKQVDVFDALTGTQKTITLKQLQDNFQGVITATP